MGADQQSQAGRIHIGNLTKVEDYRVRGLFAAHGILKNSAVIRGQRTVQGEYFLGIRFGAVNY
jgi:hypothetical protein